MKRHFLGALALVLAIGLLPQAARAQANNNLLTWLFGNQDPRLTTTGIALGLGADAGSYVLSHKHGIPATRIASPGVAYGVTAFGCAVVYPILGTMVLNRPLTPREAYVGIANCFIPIIGGWIVNASLPHDPWYDGMPPRPVVRHHHWHHRARAHRHR